MTTNERSFSKLSRLKTFNDRFDYLVLTGEIGIDLFGENRLLNQKFYTSKEWRSVKDYVVVRDNGLDLGCVGYDVTESIVVHHMNPITPEDLINFNPKVLDPEFLITTSVSTHLAIHYGDPTKVPRLSMDRKTGDTKLW